MGPHGVVEGAALAPVAGGMETARQSSGLLPLSMTGSPGSGRPFSVRVQSGSEWGEMKRGYRVGPSAHRQGLSLQCSPPDGPFCKRSLILRARDRRRPPVNTS